MPNRRNESLERNWTKWEDAYEKTEMIEYAVLAIGKWPHAPPEWAVQACKSFWMGEERKSRGDYDDGYKLDQVADRILSGATIHAASLATSGEGETGSNTQRLMRKWNEELEASTILCPDSGGPIHPRLERAAVRRAKRDGNYMLGRWNPSARPYQPPTNPTDPEVD